MKRNVRIQAALMNTKTHLVLVLELQNMLEPNKMQQCTYTGLDRRSLVFENMAPSAAAVMWRFPHVDAGVLRESNLLMG